jgi:hypothetical protein
LKKCVFTLRSIIREDLRRQEPIETFFHKWWFLVPELNNPFGLFNSHCVDMESLEVVGRMHLLDGYKVY